MIPQTLTILASAVSKEMDESGSYVFDVQLLEAFDDTADPGYYDDNDLPPEILAEVLQKSEGVKSFVKK